MFAAARLPAAADGRADPGLPGAAKDSEKRSSETMSPRLGSCRREAGHISSSRLRAAARLRLRQRRRQARLRRDGYVQPRAHQARRIEPDACRLDGSNAHELTDDDPDGVRILSLRRRAWHNAAAVALLESEGYRTPVPAGFER